MLAVAGVTGVDWLFTCSFTILRPSSSGDAPDFLHVGHLRQLIDDRHQFIDTVDLDGHAGMNDLLITIGILVYVQQVHLQIRQDSTDILHQAGSLIGRHTHLNRINCSCLLTPVDLDQALLLVFR